MSKEDFQSETILLLVSCALFFLLTACYPQGEKTEVISSGSKQQELKVAISDECSDVGKELVEDYAASKGIAVNIVETHSREAKAYLQNGSVDAAIVTVRVIPTKHDELFYVPFAYNGIIFVADREARVEDLSKIEVKGILSGKINNWKEVGGADLPIIVISRPDHSSAKKKIDSFLASRIPAKSDGVSSIFAETNLAAISATRRLKGFFSYILVSGRESDAYGGIPLSIEGMKPLITNVPHASYPVPLELGFLLRGDYSDDAGDLVDFLLTSRGVHRIALLGLVPVAGNMKIADCHCRGRDSTEVPDRGFKQGFLTLGVVPEIGVTKQEKRYRRLAKHIADKMNITVRLKHLESYKRLVEEFERGTIEAAFVGSYTYGILNKDIKVIPVARPLSHGSAEYRGLLVVKKEGGIKGLSALKGKRVSYVPLTTAGELFMNEVVASAGGRPESYFGHAFPAPNHEEAFNMLINGKVEGAFIKDLVLERIFDSHPELRGSVTILKSSLSVPENALVVSQNVFNLIGARLREILVGLDEGKEGKAVLEDMGAEKFVPTTRDDYGNLYKIAEKGGRKL